MDRQAIYDLIKAAREALKPSHPDAATIETILKADTDRQYKSEAKRLFGIDPVTGEPNKYPTDAAIVIANVRQAKTIATLRKRARSVRHVAINMLHILLKNIDKAQRNGHWDTIEKLVEVPTFKTCIELANMMPTDYKAGWKQTKKRHSKKLSLHKLPEDWREQIEAKSEGQYRMATLVSLATGCRPAELEKGVLLERKADGIYATINGAKVKENAGQKERCFRLADHPITDLISDFMTKDKDLPDILLVSVEAGKSNSVTTHIRSIAKKLWPRHKESVTCYTARHAMASDCKKAIAEGADPDLVSLVLGHIVDKTVTYYGNMFQGGGKRMAPSNVTATKPIKHKLRERNFIRKQNQSYRKKQNRTKNTPRD